MNWVDRFVIASLSPQWALRRAQARKVLSYYESAEPGRLRKQRTDKRSANAQNLKSADSLRTQARHLEQNFDVACGALDVLVNNIVGVGIVPEPQVMLANGEPAEDVNRDLLKLWDDWIHSPDVTRQQDYYTLQRLLCRSWIRDGEVFGQRLIGSVPLLDHNTVLPYSLEVLEADFVPIDLFDAAKGISQGVELNVWGAPRAYHVYKSHPGDAATTYGLETKRVAADRMFHVKLVKRLHQVRGISQFASVINRFDDIKEIDESERVAARVAAAMAGYIKKGTPDLYEADSAMADPVTGEPQLRSMEMVPGMIYDDLRPGEDIGTINSNRPNNALIPFRDSQLRSAAGGLGASYSSLSKNYNGTYSAQRQELVEQYAHYRAMSGYLVFRLCQPVWDGFIDSARLSGAVKFTGVDLTTIYDASHTVPPMPWIDPVKEVTAAQLAEDRGYTSRSRIIRQRGENPDQVNREIQRDQREVERLGIKLGGPDSGSVEPEPTDPPEKPDEDPTEPVKPAAAVSVRVEQPPPVPRRLKVGRAANGEIVDFIPEYGEPLPPAPRSLRVARSAKGEIVGFVPEYGDKT